MFLLVMVLCLLLPQAVMFNVTESRVKEQRTVLIQNNINYVDYLRVILPEYRKKIAHDPSKLQFHQVTQKDLEIIVNNKQQGQSTINWVSNLDKNIQYYVDEKNFYITWDYTDRLRDAGLAPALAQHYLRYVCQEEISNNAYKRVYFSFYLIGFVNEKNRLIPLRTYTPESGNNNGIALPAQLHKKGLLILTDCDPT